MNSPRNDKRLDDALSKAMGSPPPQADFAEWRTTNTPDEFSHLKWDEETETEKSQGSEETLL